ncbi:MAG: PaeR7I family type II restriction endonuclease [Bryobacteraceae bacterium]
MDFEKRLQDAVQRYWDGRNRNLAKQKESGIIDAGTRGAVTAGTQMGALEVLIVDVLCEAGLQKLDVKTRTGLELPGYFRPEKKWDLIVVSEGQLVLAMEFKSMVGSFGKNLNNRSEEALGSATCLWTAYREGRFGAAPTPFLGYFFLLEDHAEVHEPKGYSEPYFAVDPVFKTGEGKGRRSASGVSYSKRFEILCRRLVLERLYSATCLVLATNESPTRITQPADDLSFGRFVAGLRGHVMTFLETRKSG